VNDARPPRWLAAGLLSITALSVAAAIFLPGTFRALGPFTPDSQTYLTWNPGRTPGYPMFLAGVRLISPELTVLGPLQLMVFLAAASMCAWSFAHVYGRPFITLLFAAGVVLHPQLVSYAFVALPESLFASSLCLTFATVLPASRSSRLLPYAGVGLCIALSILIKPSGYGITAGLLAVALCARPQRWLSATVAGLSIALVLGAVATGNFMRHGFFAPQAQGGFSVVAHVGPFIEPVQSGPLAAVANAIAADVKPHRDALERIDDLAVYYLFSSHDYHSIERIVRQRIGADVEQRFGSAGVDSEQFPSNPILLREITATGAALARQAVIDHPGAYARHVAAQLYGLWFLPLFQSSGRIARLSTALEGIRAASPALDRSEVAFRTIPAAAFVVIRLLFLCILVASIAQIVLAVIRRTRPLLPLAFAALALHANYLLVAAVQPGLPRYAVVMWPAAGLVLAGSAVLLLGWIDEKRHR
jgi:hypothetical protein